MPEEKNKKHSGIYPELEPAYSILTEVSEKLNSAQVENQDIQSVLESSLDQYHQAKEIFLAEEQPWLAAWVDLQKASLHCQLADGANYVGRGVQAHTAMTLINDVLGMISALPPHLDLTASIYISMTETLFRVRSLFEKPDQTEAIDNLIRGVSENLGEALALDQLYRAEANDLEFTAEILDGLVEADFDPEAAEQLTLAASEIREQVKVLDFMTSATRRP